MIMMIKMTIGGDANDGYDTTVKMRRQIIKKEKVTLG